MDETDIKNFRYDIEWDKYRKYGIDISETAYISVKKLKKYIEFDRKKYPAAKTILPNYLESLKNDISEHGISYSLVLDVNINTGFIRLSEGNHRIMIAEELGIESVPVKLKMNNIKPNNGEEGIRGAFLESIKTLNEYPSIQDIADLIEIEES